MLTQSRPIPKSIRASCAQPGILPCPETAFRQEKNRVLRAILTDSHFWLPLLVLLLGIGLLLRLV
jgi:hypothetical protein